MRSSSRDVDLQATVSEVRPDGNETFVQNGWMRASERKLSTSANNIFKQPSTLLDPIPSELASDAEPLPKGRFVEVVIPLYYEGHVYRAGLADPRHDRGAQRNTADLVVHANGPGARQDDQGVGRILQDDALEPDPPGRSGVTVPTGLPPCPSLRNEPCRPYVPYHNLTAKS